MSSGNPYVGPRTFRQDEGHLFFGRDREARDLLSLVVSEQLVLFYAQSGAGKSSLINTRLIPNLGAKSFEVLRVGRVSGEDTAGLEIDNIYIFNLLQSLLQRHADVNVLTRLTLEQFLCRLKKDEKGYFYDGTDADRTESTGKSRRALIIDQFEEIFSTHPEAWEKREDFFVQLAQAMESDPHLWVVLVMREDYIAYLDPYAHLLPNGLRVRYYMQRLGRDAAIKAVRSPAEKIRPYEDGVAEKLINDLCSIKVQKQDGSLDIQPGQYVEPVQLQVVCYGLWENLPQQGDRITEKDLQDVGDVDQALGKYYDRRVQDVARAKKVRERLIREWFERKLIAPGGIRNMVLQERDHKSGELDDDVIQALQSDLVRSEKRGGVTWYELTHDRLVEPILERNKIWFNENLSPLQRQAALWNDQGRNETWLLTGQALLEMEQWAKEHPDELTDAEIDFLKACRKRQAEIKLNEQAESAKRFQLFFRVVTSLAIIAIVAGGVAIVSSVKANQASHQAQAARSTAVVAEATAQSNARLASTAQANAEVAQLAAQQNANQALAGNLAAQANIFKNSDHALALLLAVEAYKREQSPLTTTTLFDLLQYTPFKKVSDFSGSVKSAAISPDGTRIAIASCKDSCTLGEIRLFDQTMKPAGTLPGRYGIVNSLAFHQYEDRLVLAAGGCDLNGCEESSGQITFWEITSSGNSLLSQIRAHANLVKTIAFSSDGNLLASGSYDTFILLWNVADLKKPYNVGPPLRHDSFVNQLVFSPDDNYLVSAGDDRSVYVWNVSQRNNTISRQPFNKYSKVYTNSVTAVAFSPDGKTLASAGYDNLVRLWDWDAGNLSPRRDKILEGHTGYVTSLAFTAEGWLASTGFDGQVIIWDITTGQQLGPAMKVHTKAVNQVAAGSFASDGVEHPYLISVSNDLTAIQWDLFTRNPLSPYPDYADPKNQSLVAAPDDWTAQACEAAKRNLTTVEWTRYLSTPFEKTCPSYP